MPASDMFSVLGIGVARHGQHVDPLAHLLDALLVGDAESLLFVDDQQTEIPELDVLRQQAVRADDDFDFAGFQIFERLLLFGLGPEPADHVDANGERRKAIPQRLDVLECEDGGRAPETRPACRPLPP